MVMPENLPKQGQPPTNILPQLAHRVDVHREGIPKLLREPFPKTSCGLLNVPFGLLRTDHDEEIDVAVGTLLASGDTSINGSRHNPGPESPAQLLTEGIQKMLEEAGLLTEKGPQEPVNKVMVVPEGVEEIAADLPEIQNRLFMQGP